MGIVHFFGRIANTDSGNTNTTQQSIIIGRRWLRGSGTPYRMRVALMHSDGNRPNLTRRTLLLVGVILAATLDHSMD